MYSSCTHVDTTTTWGGGGMWRGIIHVHVHVGRYRVITDHFPCSYCVRKAKYIELLDSHLSCKAFNLNSHEKSRVT